MKFMSNLWNRLRPGVYEAASVLVGVPFTFLVLAVIYFRRPDMWRSQFLMDPTSVPVTVAIYVGVAIITNLLVARAFRSQIVLAQGWLACSVYALVIGYINILLFSSFVSFGIGMASGVILGAIYAPLIVPLCFVAFAVMRFVDRHDRRSLWRQAHA